MRQERLDFVQELERQIRDMGLPRAGLAKRAGITHRALDQMLHGDSNCSVETLLAVANAAGLAVLIVPKPTAQPGITAPSVLTVVQAALNRIRPPPT